MNRDYYRTLGNQILLDIKNKNLFEPLNFNLLENNQINLKDFVLDSKTLFLNEPLYILSNLNESIIYIQFIKI